eukprot:6773388-Alexandrium_andersonii.AAC.1
MLATNSRCGPLAGTGNSDEEHRKRCLQDPRPRKSGHTAMDVRVQLAEQPTLSRRTPNTLHNV